MTDPRKRILDDMEALNDYYEEGFKAGRRISYFRGWVTGFSVAIILMLVVMLFTSCRARRHRKWHEANTYYVQKSEMVDISERQSDDP